MSNFQIMLMVRAKKDHLILLIEYDSLQWVLRMLIYLGIRLIYYCYSIRLRRLQCKSKLFKNLNISRFHLENVQLCNWQNCLLLFNLIWLTRDLDLELIIIIRLVIDIQVMVSLDNAQILWLRKYIVKLFQFLQSSLP